MYATPRGYALKPKARKSRPSLRPRLATLAVLLLAGMPVHADITKTDVQVAARALSFVSDPLSGTVRVGIVYARSSPRSVREAERLRTIIADGLRIGAIELRPVLIETADAAGADVDLFFLTEHLAATETPNLLGNHNRPILCITTDIEQVRNGACVMGVRSQPKVEVFVNRASASASEITFSTVFRVMITEL
jgi:hypothetical protein